MDTPPGPIHPRRPFQPILLLPYAVFVVHTLEELPGFAAWTSSAFGPHSTGTFVLQHIPLFLFVLLVGIVAGIRQRGAWLVLALACGVQFALNGIFHLIMWPISGSYPPGVLTGIGVSLPAGVALFWWARRTGLATPRQLVAAGGIGAVIALAAIGTLAL